MKLTIPNGNKLWLLCCFCFFIVLSCCSLNVPFFWDSVTFSKIADHFYRNGFNGFIVPASSDTGGFPLYGFYIACCWMIFGKSLAVSHLAFLPFLLGVVWEFYKFSKRFLPARMLPIALLLLMAEPCLVTQSMLMAYDVILVYFLLLAANSLLKGNYFWYGTALLFMVFFAVRGLFAIPAFGMIHLILVFYFKDRKARPKDIFVYIPVITVFAGWLLYHKLQTGWFLMSPLLDVTDQKMVGPAMMLRQFIYIIWKIADFGRVFIWLAFAVMVLMFRKHIKGRREFQYILMFLMLPLLINMLFMIPLSNPVGHRYFLFTYITLITAVTYIIQFIERKVVVRAVVILFCAVMLSGNFWLWPEKYGNGWDCSLKVVRFFGMERQAKEFIVSQQLRPEDIATDFPLQADTRFTRLTASAFKYCDKGTAAIGTFKYVLHSNISNKFSPSEMRELQEKWALIYSDRHWPVYIRIYKNPAFIAP